MMVWAEIRSPLLNQLSQPGAPESFYLLYIPFSFCDWLILSVLYSLLEAQCLTVGLLTFFILYNCNFILIEQQLPISSFSQPLASFYLLFLWIWLLLISYVTFISQEVIIESNFAIIYMRIIFLQKLSPLWFIWKFSLFVVHHSKVIFSGLLWIWCKVLVILFVT